MSVSHNSPRAFLRASFAIALVLIPQVSFAQSCNVDMAAVEKSIGRFEPSYGDVRSDVGCGTPVNAARRLVCDSSAEAPGPLSRMARLDDLAWVYAYENATKQEVDRGNPPRDAGFIAQRDACTDAACLCRVLIDHTNASLGGESPYSQD